MFLSAFKRAFRSLPGEAPGWIICTAVLLLTTVRIAVLYSFGLFVAKLESRDNSTSMAVQDWIGTLTMTFSYGLSPVTVLLIRSLGHHGYQVAAVSSVLLVACSCFLSAAVVRINELWMFLTFSVLYGIGSSLGYMSSSLILGEYFGRQHKHHVLATSVLLSGYPVSSLIFNPLNGWLIDTYGLRVAFITNGCLTFVIGLICCLPFLAKLDSAVPVDEPNMDCGYLQHHARSCCNPKLCAQRPEIILWLLGILLSYIDFFMPFVNLAFYMKLKNIDLAHSKWAISAMSLTEFTAYVVASAVGDRFKGRLVIINLIAAAGLSILCFVWPFVDKSYGAVVALCAVMGPLQALSIVYQFAASAEVTQLPVDVAWSATSAWSGLGILVGPLFYGAVFDIRHRYDDVWMVNGGLYLAQALVFAAIPIVWLCRGSTIISQGYGEIAGETMDLTESTMEVRRDTDGSER